MTRPLAPLLRRTAVGTACALLLAATAACTADTTASSRPPEASPPASIGSTQTIAPKPVPLEVRVTRVSGRLPSAARAPLERNVAKAIGGYFDAAFLGGRYPRTSFDDAFPTFSAGAATSARRDRDLLTNQVLGPTTRSVTPKSQAAYLSVFAPNKVAAGITARIRLRFVAERGERAARAVTVTGRLLLSRKDGGTWQIFGYDVAQSVSPAQTGSSS